MASKRIYNTNGKLTEDEMLNVARVLIKAGYTVKMDKQKLDNKYYKYIEYDSKMEGNE